MEEHSHWFIHAINVLVALATWLIPFAVSHATLEKPYAYEILLLILLFPLIIGLSRCFYFKIAPLSLFIPLMVLPAITRDDVPTPSLAIFAIAAAAIMINLISAVIRRLPLCSSVPDKRPQQIRAIDMRLYPNRTLTKRLFFFIIPLRFIGDLAGMGFLFTILFFPHFFTVVLWLVWAGISVISGTLELVPAMWSFFTRNQDADGLYVDTDHHYAPVDQVCFSFYYFIILQTSYVINVQIINYYHCRSKMRKQNQRKENWQNQQNLDCHLMSITLAI